jgi:hypothetical protein
MGIPKLVGKGLVLAVSAALAILLLVSRGANADHPVQGQTSTEGQLQFTPVLHYQGRLLDPATKNPKPDGTYRMIFTLYDAPTGGTVLWSETKDVSVTNGLFSTLLGDTTPLDQSDFDGRALWLGVTVGADPEATPRQRVAYAAYSLRANDADTVDGQHAAAFAATSHSHSGADIRSGTVAEARIDAAIARDSEIMPTVLSADGAGSGLDADLLDGQQASAFAAVSHSHSAADITSGTLSRDRFSAYDDLVAEDKIGSGRSQVAAGAHDHDDRYYTESESDSRYVNASGDTMSGVLTVPRVAYTTPRTHYFIVGSEGFVPGSNVDYQNTYGNGGAYISSGSGALVAPVHLPHGAVVTEFKVFFDDTSSNDMTVYLFRQNMLGGGYTILADVSSTGISGYGSQTDTTISPATIDNTAYSYHVHAYSTAWGSSLKIKGALITYTISEAP